MSSLIRASAGRACELAAPVAPAPLPPEPALLAPRRPPGPSTGVSYGLTWSPDSMADGRSRIARPIWPRGFRPSPAASSSSAHSSSYSPPA